MLAALVVSAPVVAGAQPHRGRPGRPGAIQPFSPQVEATLRQCEALFDRSRFAEAVTAIDALPPRARALPRVRALRAASRIGALVPAVEPDGWRALPPATQRELSALEPALSAATEDPRASLSLGRLHLLRARLDDARAALERSTRLRPEDPVAWNDLAMVLVTQHHLPEAERALVEATRRAPSDPEPFDNLGAVRLAQGRARESLEAFERAVEIDPRSPRFLSDLGSAQLSAGRIPEAVGTLQRAVALDPSSSVVAANLGYALSLANRSDEAVRVLTHATELDPRNLTALNNLGLVHLRRGERALARRCFERALTADATDPRARANLDAMGAD
ncbi:MAG: tetratricopeptide repeat protein [Polyangiales bacterium]